MRKRIGIPLTIIIFALLFITLKDINFYEAFSLLKNLDISYFSFAMLSGFSLFLIWTFRWQHTMKGYLDANYFFLLRVLFAGVFVNTLTPGTGIGGEAVRAYYVGKKYKRPQTKLLGYIAADATFNAIVFFLFTILSLIFAFVVFDISIESEAILPITITAIAIATALSFIIWKNAHSEELWLAKKLYRFKTIEKHFHNLHHFEYYFVRKIHNFTYVFKEVVTDKHKIWLGIFLSVIYRILEATITYFILLGLDIHISFISVIVIAILSRLIGDLTPIPGGIGVVEGSMILLYSAIGLAAPTAAVVALLSRLIVYFYNLLVGGISLLILQKKYG
ncbi:MAG: flippase-like domain-containing protein [Nanoarchaeota archaeon]|nr:flippase-like domain-containing protein [Nanoarchaeota archaeon]MBU1103332.1 flippase-like domain-containing protein [Nanoarchaeota archaeon]